MDFDEIFERCFKGKESLEDAHKAFKECYYEARCSPCMVSFIRSFIEVIADCDGDEPVNTVRELLNTYNNLNSSGVFIMMYDHIGATMSGGLPKRFKLVMNGEDDD